MMKKNAASLIDLRLRSMSVIDHDTMAVIVPATLGAPIDMRPLFGEASAPEGKRSLVRKLPRR
jgi:hypothetical protein